MCILMMTISVKDQRWFRPSKDLIYQECVETAMVYRSNDIYLSHPPNYIRMNIQSELTL